MRNIHFISGLPRSGSTLLGAVLRQNPHFRAGMSSPVANIYSSLQVAMSAKSEFYPFFDEERRMRMLHAVFDAYYADEPDDVTIFDTSRAWTSKMPGLARLFPDAKVICCVRSVPWILDSLERQTQRNPFEPSKIFHFQAGGNVQSRIDLSKRPNGLVGSALNSLKEAYYGEYTDRLLLVRYESLVKDPIKTIGEIYAFIGAELFSHDLDNLRFSAEAFDRGLGAPGLHSVRPRLEPDERESVLPPEIFSKFAFSSFWEPQGDNPRNVKIL